MSDEQPRLLIIETSGRCGQVAIALGDDLRAVRQLDEARRHARDLAPAVGELLRAQAWTPRDLHAIIVSLGPGSYTGLRVGVMSAKALCYATGCALLAVETFRAIAAQAPESITRLDVISDAQQDKVYVQQFARDEGGRWAPLSHLGICSISEWLSDRDPRAWVSGPGVDAHVRRLPEGLPLVDAELRLPRAESLLRIGLERYRAGERDDVWKAEPIYLRPSAAEEQWRRRQEGGG